MERLWFVKDIPLFERLTESEIRPLEYHSRAQTFARGTSIDLPEEPSVFLISDGCVSLEVTYRHDQSPVTAQLEPGDFLGIVPGCSSLLHGNSIAADTAATVIAIPPPFFDRIIDRHSDVVTRVSRRAGFKQNPLTSWLTDLVFRTTRQRVARILLNAVSIGDFQPTHGVSLPVPLSLRELTRLAGSDLEVAQYAIELMADDDLVRWDNNGFHLLDPRRLAHDYLRPAATRTLRMWQRREIRAR